MNTSKYYSPHDLLPAPEPCTVSPPDGQFYDTVAKHLIKDTVRVMMNGLPIDLQRVQELEVTLDHMLAGVHATLANNAYIASYLRIFHSKLTNDYKLERKSMLRPIDSFLKDFKNKDPVHRAYFMHIFADQQKLQQPSELLPTGIAKWPAKTVKKLSATKPLLVKLLEGTLPANHSISTAAMQLLAEHKAELHNRKYLDQIATPTMDLPPFNPNSTPQLQGLFASLSIPSEATTDAGAPSWDRDQVERVNKEYHSDPIVKEMTQALIDHSFGATIKSTYVPAFYKYTVNGKLHGTLKLFGAKTFRYTSQSPNLLNMPSTKSIYAKPIKRCFTAPPDQLVYAIDLSALEDRVIASLSRDKNKCSVFLDGLDGHCLNAYGYFPEEIAALMTLTHDTTTDVKAFDKLRGANKALDAIRQRGKPATLTTKRLYMVTCIE